MFAADYPFIDVFWSMLIFFFWVIWIWILITVFVDLFRRHDISGWAKAAWMVFVIVLPYPRRVHLHHHPGPGHDRAPRPPRCRPRTPRPRTASASVAAAPPSSPAEQIERAKSLLDSGAIDQAEFDRLKAKALA